MADKEKDMWLKLIIGFVLTLIGMSFGFTANVQNDKVDKYTFEKHEEYQKQQFDAMEKRDKERHDAVMKVLERIEGNKL